MGDNDEGRRRTAKGNDEGNDEGRRSRLIMKKITNVVLVANVLLMCQEVFQIYFSTHLLYSSHFVVFNKDYTKCLQKRKHLLFLFIQGVLL
jgi:hypothetical protein